MNKLLLPPTFLLLSGLLAIGTAHAQSVVPNGAMENWTLRNGSDTPIQWLVTDDILHLSDPNQMPTGSVLKSTSSHGGSFAAQMVTIPQLAGTPPAPIGVPGVVILGTAFGNLTRVDSLVLIGGLPFTSRPARLQFYYKASGTNTNPGTRPVAHLMLTKTTNGVRQTVATGRMNLPNAGSYTLANIPLKYLQGFAPDSIHLAFGSGDFDGLQFPIGNTLYVDDISLSGTVTATRDAQLQAAVGVYPNPSASGLFTLTAQESALIVAPLTVTDALGRVVLRQPAGAASAGARTLNLRQQPAGIYTLRLDTPRGLVVHKLVIQ